MAEKIKQNLVSSLCKRSNLDPKNSDGDVEKSDLKSLCISILSSSPGGSSILDNVEVMRWIEFANSFPLDSKACDEAINGLNNELLHVSVLVGGGFKVSVADVIVYLVVHPFMIAMSKSAREKFVNILRWMDYVQNKEDLGNIVERIPIERATFEVIALATSVASLNLKGAAKDAKPDKKDKNDAVECSKTVKNVPKDMPAKAKGDKAAADADQKKPVTATAAKDDVPVSLLNIKVGLIRKAWKHPSADSLLVEEIDVGESKVRQVVSGLAKYCSPDDLSNRRVALITNVKPGKLRDVVSEGLVLCASSEDHTVVEPLLPPEAAQVGERISFSGHEGKPEDVLNPKKKQLDKITPHLFTDENGVATYKGIPFMTSGGPCTSSIRKGSIK